MRYRLIGSFLLIIAAIIGFLTIQAQPGLSSEETAPFPPRRNAVVAVVEKAGPAVVNISTEKVVQKRVSPFYRHDPLWFDFFEPFRRDVREESLGTGVIINKNGYVLTNEHVILPAATKIRIMLSDNQEFEGELIGSSARFDLAVIKIEGEKKLPFLEPADSDDLMIGETVIAIGNPYGLSHTVTTGVISALKRSVEVGEGRVYRDFIQTDASINPGNSGGPLLNIQGELIGVNSAIYKEAQGIGFAIPINKAKRVLDDLISFGKVLPVWFGLYVQDINRSLARSFGLPSLEGVLVSEVMENAPADKSGVKRGDVILEIAGTKVLSASHYRELICEFTVGDPVNLTLWRDSKVIETIMEGVAIPEDRAEEITRSRFGVAAANVNRRNIRRYGLAVDYGVVITHVEPGSPAAKKGLAPGDVITKVNDAYVENMEQFKSASIKACERGAMLLVVVRGRRAYYVNLES